MSSAQKYKKIKDKSVQTPKIRTYGDGKILVEKPYDNKSYYQLY